jgi:hypothetical protein
MIGAMTNRRGGAWISGLLGLLGIGWLVGPAVLIGSAIWITTDYWLAQEGVSAAAEDRASVLVRCAVALLVALPLLGLVIAGLTGRNVAMVTFGVLLALTLSAAVVVADGDVGSFLSPDRLWATSSRP